MITRYEYLGGAAWHFDDDDGLTKEKYKTWSTYRGYGHVRVETGGQDPVGMKTQTDHYFLRGMDGDKASPTGGTKEVTVSDDYNGTIIDHDSAAGLEYKTEQYSGPGGKVLGKTVNTPWHHETAKRVRSWGTTTANLTGIAATRTWTSLDDGAGSQWRITYKTNTFEDTIGRVVQTDDFGDNSTPDDDQCTRTTYAENITSWMLTPVARSETVAKPCDATDLDRSKDVIADVRTSYDGQDYAKAPTKGDATLIATLKSNDGTTATYLETGNTYDDYGRLLTNTDLTATAKATETTAPVRTERSDGLTTTTAYTPTTGLPTSIKVTTPPATSGNTATAQTTRTSLEPLRGLPTAVLDTNNKRTDTTYDALGRKLKVWLPNRSKANSNTPNYEFSYTVAEDQPSVVGTTTLYGTGRKTSYTIYDGLLRPRQTQSPGPQGGRLVSEIFYDERGLTSKEFAPYYNTCAPSTTDTCAPPTSLLALDEPQLVETQTWNTYDGLGRITKSQQVGGNGDGGQVLSTASTDYQGDRTTVTPPQGGIPTTTVIDARGHLTQVWQYHNATPTGDADKTLYSYTSAGKLAQLTDPAGNTWSYGYDQRGNQISAQDPDRGSTASVFDDRSQLVSTTDSRGKKVTHVYDLLGRETETHDGDASAPLLTKHVWDPSGSKGQLSSATRYVDGDAYTIAYQLYDNLYRPTRTTTTIPATTANGALAGSYQDNIRYNEDGTVQSVSYPAAGKLPAESITPTYDEILRPKTLSGSGGLKYITDTVYSFTGKPLEYTYQATDGKGTQVTNIYEWGTQRLSNSRVDRQDIPGTDRSATYAYDQSGNILSISDVSRDGTDNQCFTYDYLARITEAWTQNTTTCAGAPSASLLGGPAPYWASYTYDLTGNRKSETDHDPSGDAAKDVERTYTYPAAKAPQPHTLTQVEVTGPNATSVDSFGYDEAGNTITRTVGGDEQTLTWASDNLLGKVTSPDGSGGTSTTSYVYDADGNRLLSRTGSSTTLFLTNTEVTLAKGAETSKATRYYDLGGGNQAIRTDDNTLSFLIGDHHGTSELAVKADDLSMQQQRSMPFGDVRGKKPSTWPGDKGFVGGTKDTTTGLTHLGARDYDPATGRFLSVDPLAQTDDPQSLNGYAYSENSPVTSADPTGLFCDGCSHNNPDSVWTAKNGPGCTSEACYDMGGHMLYPVVSGGWTKPKPRPAPAQPTIAGKPIPTERQLQALGIKTPWNSYHDAIHLWATNICGGLSSTVSDDNAYGQFCAGAGQIGLLKDKHPWVGVAIAVIAGCSLAPEACVGAAADAVTGEIDLAAGGSISAGAALNELRGNLRGLYKSLGDDGGVVGAACSFSPDTPVLLKSGKTKPIGKVKPGDTVESADPNDGRHQGTRTVTARLVHHDDDLLDLTIQTSKHHTSTIHTTSNHPFWDDTARTWVSAGDLQPGHNLETATDHHATVVRVHAHPGAADMYNLTVKQLHTYYVMAGRTPVLVHNSMENCSDAAFQTVLHNEQEIIDGKSSHIIPGMDSRTPEGSDALADYVDRITSTPGTPLLNGGGEAWYDGEKGLYTFRGGSPAVPSGSVFRAPPEYFTNKTGVQIKK